MGERHVVHVVKAGDFRSAFARLSGGGEEYYAAERAGVEAMQRLGVLAGRWTVLNGITPEPYDEALTPHLHAVGLGAGGGDVERRAVAWLEANRPTEVVIGNPMLPVMDWCARAGVRALPLWADTFFGLPRSGPPHARLRAWVGNRRWTARLSAALRRLNPEWASNHNLNASRQLVSLGLSPSRVVPYEQPEAVDPTAFAPRSAPPAVPFTLQYVGAVSTAKGVGDLIDAVSLLVRRGRDVRCSIVGGGGELDAMKQRATQLGVADRVVFEGKQAHAAVLSKVASAAAAVVPSRHVYPEGLPLTLMEALAVRTPLIASDHPAWAGRLHHGRDALIFRSDRPAELAAQVARLMDEPGLYARLSSAGGGAYASLRCPLVVHELLERWVRDGEEDRRVLRSFSLEARPFGTH